MTQYAPIVDRLLDQVGPFVSRLPGTHASETPMPRLKVLSSTVPTSPTPALFRPMFYAVLRGTKVLSLGNNRFELSAGACAATSFGLPFVGHFEKASRAAPYVAVSLDLDVDLLVDVILQMTRCEDTWVCSASGGQLAGAVGEAFLRLIALTDTTDDLAMLGRHYERELYYRLLQSSMGDTLRQLGQRDNRLRRIKAAADWLCSNTDKPIVISDLAETAGMSVTSFHRHFKAVTGHSPLAFQRQMRLLEARQLLAAGGLSVAKVAFSVGYVSPSQFSREYKSMFGTPPANDLAR
ncbi:AraC family transcriptional regulator [Rhizobium sp. P38BS-XIX]|nr:AraC family transcriptional regulator [Rhizobium sp. P38BS-XIX]